METILFGVLVLQVINGLLLIAVAGTVAKLIRYVTGEEVPAQAQAKKTTDGLVGLPSSPLYQLIGGELIQVGTPTYDTAVLRGKAEPFADGLDRRPATSRNWDGLTITEV